MLHVMFYGVYVRQAFGEAEKCLVGCQLTKAELLLQFFVLSSTNCMGAFGLSKNRVGICS